MPNGTEARLRKWTCSARAAAVGGNYLPAKTVGHIVYLAGVISRTRKA